MALQEDGGLESYLSKMSLKRTWGDGLMIEAAMRLYNRPIIVMISGKSQNRELSQTKVTYPGIDPKSLPMFLGYTSLTKQSKTQTHYVSLLDNKCALDIKVGTSDTLSFASHAEASPREPTSLDASHAEDTPLVPTSLGASHAENTHVVPTSLNTGFSQPVSSAKYDIGEAVQQLQVGVCLTDYDRENFLSNRYKPNKREDYPFSVKKTSTGMYNDYKRYLCSSHLDKFPWLAVSSVMKGAWCAYCVLFKTSECGGGKGADVGRGGGQRMGTLVTKPLTQFLDLTGKNGVLTRHHESQYHKTCALRVTEFLAHRGTTHKLDVRSMQDKEHQKLIEDNRRVLRPIIETVIMCGRQNIAFRGHRDDGPIATDGSEPNENDGNFRTLLRFRMRGGDSVLQSHLQGTKRNASYTSKTIQNELLLACGKLIKKKIVDDVNKSRFWTVLADETQDRSKREQLAVIVRYVKEDSGQFQILEEPVAILDLIHDIRIAESSENDANVNEVKLSGNAIGKTILRTVEGIGLQIEYLVGQGYDGASAMASQKVGVSAVIQGAAPLADYFHCCMHALNLSASQVSNVIAMRHCMDEITEMVSFYKYAKRNSHLIEVIKRFNLQSDEVGGDALPGVKRQQLVKLCQTRFTERHEAILVARQLLPCVVTSLHELTTWDSLETRKNARRLLNSILKAEFLVCLVIAEKISSLLRPVSRCLQSVGNDLVNALNDIQTLKSKLRALRANNENEFNEIFLESCNLAEEVGMSSADMDLVPVGAGSGGRSKYRPNAGEPNQNSSYYYRVNVYFPVLDAVIQDLELRFGSHHEKIARLSHLLPTFVKAASWEDVIPAVERYARFLESISVVKGEFDLWKHKWMLQDKTTIVNTAAAALITCSQEVFPNIFILLKILTVLPVTTAEPERVFSKVEKTLTSIRACMGEERLESLILLQVHRDRTPSCEEVLQEFTASGARKLKLAL